MRCAGIGGPALDVTAESVLVLERRTVRWAGYARVGAVTYSEKLLAQGVRDMVRISDCRMSGTSYGAWCYTLHPKPPLVDR